MIDFESPTDLAEQFVVGYYTSFVYEPDKLKHFYASTAQIYRPDTHDQNSGVSLQHVATASLAFHFSDSFTLNVGSYSVLLLDSPTPAVSVSVSGIVDNVSGKGSFVQNFILEERDDRIFVVADSLHYWDYRTDLGARNFQVQKPSSSQGSQPPRVRSWQPR
jgi:hypothetical protein